MVCKKCDTEATENYANNHKFYFCRVCREEVKEEEVSFKRIKDSPTPTLDFEEDPFDEWGYLSFSMWTSEGGK